MRGDLDEPVGLGAVRFVRSPLCVYASSHTRIIDTS